LRPFAGQLAHELGTRRQGCLRRAHFHGANLPRIYLLEVADIAQGRDQFGGFLRSGSSGHYESGERHTIKLLVILGVIGRNQHLVGVERGPHGFADAASQLESSEEIHIVHVKTHGLVLHRIVKFGSYGIG
jgi:hypothetical protein